MGNIEPSTTPFVGRAQDLAQLTELFEGVRIVTLLGPAGMGKTRLSREFGRRNGGWFVDLSVVHDAAGMLDAVAQTLSIPVAAGTPTRAAIDLIGHALASQSVLLVLDNLEQIVDAAAPVVSRWVEVAGSLRVLLTSRERLRITGEHVLELDPLSDADAVALFEARARALRHDFDADDAIVGDITKQLDNLPLAIELAAARINVMTPDTLRDRLAKRFKLLRDGRRDRSPRQTTLRGAIDWSWELLQPWERDAFAQCAAFHGGFDLAAAEAVIELDDEDDDAPEVMDALQTLRDKSLLRADDSSGTLRFAMLESIREYAAGKLKKHEQSEAVAARHRAHYLATGEATTGAVLTAEASDWLTRERANLLAVARGPDDVDAARAALVLEPMLLQRGPWEVLDEVTTRGLAAATSLPAELRARLHMIRGNALRHRGAMAEGRAELETARQVAEGVSVRTEALAMALTAIVDRSVGRFEEAGVGYVLALALAREHGLDRVLTITLAELGFLSIDLQKLDEAEAYCTEALATARRIGDTQVEGLAQVQLANILLSRGRHPEARGCYERALEFATRTRNVRNEGIVRCNLGMVLLELGLPDEAYPSIEQGLALSNRVGNRRFSGISMGYLGLSEVARGNYAEAERWHRASLDVHRDMGTTRWIVQELGNLGILYLLWGRVEEAERTLREAIAQADAHGRTDASASFRVFYAAVLANRDVVDEAKAALEEARPLLDDPDDAARSILFDAGRGFLALHRARKGDTDGVADARRAWTVARDVCSLEVRLAARLLEQGLAAINASDPASPEVAPGAVEVGAEGGWFRVPGDERVDISRRRVLRRVLAALVTHRLEHPGNSLDTDGVLAAGWPGERVLPEAGQNRVYVAIATLRKLGLGDLLQTSGEGYRLDPDTAFAQH